MAVTYKDIDTLSQKSSVAGTEKIPVSDTQYITPSQIVSNCVPLSGGILNEDAYLSVPDSDGVYVSTIAYNGVFVERSGSTRYKVEITPNYLKLDEGSDFAKYQSGNIVRRLNSVDYNIALPSAAGTLALTSNIPTVPTNVSAFTNDIGYAKKVHLTDESDMPASPDSDTLYLIDDDGASASYELSTRKVTSLSSSSTDIQYPSAKCVYDNLATKQKIITVSSSEPTSADGSDGDIWIVI